MNNIDLESRLAKGKWYLIVLSLLIIFLFITCQDDHFIEWEINTGRTEFLNDSIIFHGKIQAFGESKASGYGFYFNTNSTENHVYKRVPTYKEDFSLIIPDTLEEGSELLYKAFVETEDGLVYGEESEITGIPKYITIEDFEPKFGVKDDYFKLYGTHFNKYASQIKLHIGKLESEIIEITDKRIIAKIPFYLETDSAQLVINNGEESFITNEYFKLNGPEIIKISPSEGGGANLIISITGKNFCEIPHHNVVTIGNTQGEVMESSRSFIKVKMDTRNLMPGKQLLIVNSAGISTSQEFNVTTNWLALESKPGDGLGYPAIFSVDSKLYFCTGNNNDWDLDNDNEHWEYDIINNEWTKKSDFPGLGRAGAFAFVINDKVYFGSGAQVSPLYHITRHVTFNDFWEYDPVNDSWNQLEDLPFGFRGFTNYFSFNGKGYVGMGRTGGFNEGEIKTDWWEFNPSNNKWKQISDFPGTPRDLAHIAVINDNLYLFGGTSRSMSFKPDLWRYSFTSDSWTKLGEIQFNPLNAMYGQNKCFVMADIYSVGLRLYEFDIETNSMVHLQNYAGEYRYYGASGVVVDDQLYYGFGGWDYNHMNDFWSYRFN